MTTNVGIFNSFRVKDFIDQEKFSFLYSIFKNKYREPSFLFFLCILFPAVNAFLFGAPGLSSLKFIIYAFIYHGLNGFLFISLFKQDIPEELKLPAIFVFGISYNILFFFILSFFHLQYFSFLSVFALLALNFFHKTDFIQFKSEGFHLSFKKYFPLILLALICFVTCSSLFLINNINARFLYQGAIATSLNFLQYPYAAPHLPEASLFYHYAYNMDMAACSSITSIPMEFLATKIYPLYSFFWVLFSAFSFCKRHFKGSSATAWLFVLNAFFVLSYYSWSTAYFGNLIPISMFMLGGSISLAYAIFFIFIDRLIHTINHKPNRSDYACVLFLFFMGTISRSAFPIVILGGMSFWIAIEFFRSKKSEAFKRLYMLTQSMGILFLLSLILIYGVLSSSSAINFLSFVPQNSLFYSSTYSDGLNTWAPHFFAAYPSLIHTSNALIFLFLGAGYLTPGFYYQVYKWVKEGINNLEIFLICIAFSGFIIWNFTEAAGGSHYSFFQYTQLILGIFGATGTFLIFNDLYNSRNKVLSILGSFSFLLLCIKGYEVYDEIYRNTKLKTFSFWQPPHFSGLSSDSDEFLTKLSTLRDRNDTIVVSLLDNLSLEKAEFLMIKLKGIPFYDLHLLNSLYNNILSSKDIEERVSKIKNIINIEFIYDYDIRYLQSLFPNKSIVFLSKKDREFVTSQTSSSDEISDFKITRIMPSPPSEN